MIVFLYNVQAAFSEWETFNTNNSSFATYINFYDENNGIILYQDNSTVVKTIDGGKSWNTVFSLTDYNSSGFSAKDSIIFLTTFNETINTNKVFKSINHGDTWTEIYSESTNTFFMNIEYVNSNLIFLSGLQFTSQGANAILKKSIDGGQSFQTIYTNKTLMGISNSIFLDDSVGFIAGTDGIIEKTTDQGQTWKRVNQKNGAFLVGIYSINDSILIANAEKTGYMTRSTDKGETWVVISDKYSFGTNGFRTLIKNANNELWFVTNINAQDGHCYKSTDDGETWQLIYSQDNILFLGITMLDNKVWIVASEGRVLYNSNFVSVRDNNENSVCQVYPNPLNSNKSQHLNVKINDIAHISNISIFNSNGDEIRKDMYSVSTSEADAIQFNFNNLPTGVYFINFINDKKLSTVKFQVNN